MNIGPHFHGREPFREAPGNPEIPVDFNAVQQHLFEAGRAIVHGFGGQNLPAEVQHLFAAHCAERVARLAQQPQAIQEQGCQELLQDMERMQQLIVATARFLETGGKDAEAARMVCACKGKESEFCTKVFCALAMARPDLLKAALGKTPVEQQADSAETLENRCLFVRELVAADLSYVLHAEKRSAISSEIWSKPGFKRELLLNLPQGSWEMLLLQCDAECIAFFGATFLEVLAERNGDQASDAAVREEVLLAVTKNGALKEHIVRADADFFDRIVRTVIRSGKLETLKEIAPGNDVEALISRVFTQNSKERLSSLVAKAPQLLSFLTTSQLSNFRDVVASLVVERPALLREVSVWSNDRSMAQQLITVTNGAIYPYLSFALQSDAELLQACLDSGAQYEALVPFIPALLQEMMKTESQKKEITPSTKKDVEDAQPDDVETVLRANQGYPARIMKLLTAKDGKLMKRMVGDARLFAKFLKDPTLVALLPHKDLAESKTTQLWHATLISRLSKSPEHKSLLEAVPPEVLAEVQSFLQEHPTVR